ncbi:MAG: serine/threonine protein kinase, partial [Planctomycetales bacterium]
MDDDRSDAQPHDLDEILAEFLFAEEAGEPVSREDLLNRHPTLADELRAFFADRDQLQRIAQPISPSSHQDDLPSTIRYFGDYELLEEIAHGGMGVVYKARQTSLDRVVAVKMILAGRLATDDDVKRFLAEAKTAATLKHRSIVPIHEVGVHEGRHYFSMDFIEGRSLAELIRTEPPSPKDAARIVKNVAEAVHYAHEEGIIHRDLKPSNILIDDSGEVHVTDFGLAMRVEGDSDLTRTGQVLGTPCYMSPEQATAKRDLIGP